MVDRTATTRSTEFVLISCLSRMDRFSYSALMEKPTGEIVGIWFYNESERKRVATFLERCVPVETRSCGDESADDNLLRLKLRKLSPFPLSTHWNIWSFFCGIPILWCALMDARHCRDKGAGYNDLRRN